MKTRQLMRHLRNHAVPASVHAPYEHRSHEPAAPGQPLVDRAADALRRSEMRR